MTGKSYIDTYSIAVADYGWNHEMFDWCGRQA
jgi:4-aminobutyrate aminotransferase-like enzyme